MYSDTFNFLPNKSTRTGATYFPNEISVPIEWA